MAKQIIGVELRDAARFRAQLARLSAEAQGAVVERAAVAGAAPFLAEAKARAPVLKKDDPRRVAGNLRDKIALMVLQRRPGRVTVGVGIGRADMRAKQGGAFYALWVEYGTRFMAALPFLRPTYDTRKDEAGRTTIAVFGAWLGGYSR